MSIATVFLIAAHVFAMPSCGQQTPPRVQWTATQHPEVVHVWTTLADDCTIYLNPSLRNDPVGRCTAIIHAWGHLVGFHHSADPRNVMYVTPAPYWRCTTKRGVYGFTERRWHSPPALLQ